MTAEQRRRELQWQEQAESFPLVFQDKAVAPSSKLRCYSFLTEDSPYINVVHSLGEYFDDDGNPALQGKIICFVGDRSPEGEHHPMVLPEQTTWTWKEAIINNNAAAAATYFSDPVNRLKAWEPATQRNKVKVPRFLYLGTELGEWASRELRTLFELHKHINSLITTESEAGGGGAKIAADEASGIKVWAMSMAQRCG